LNLAMWGTPFRSANQAFYKPFFKRVKLLDGFEMPDVHEAQYSNCTVQSWQSLQ